jgi:hypothetical protein
VCGKSNYPISGTAPLPCRRLEEPTLDELGQLPIGRIFQATDEALDVILTHDEYAAFLRMPWFDDDVRRTILAAQANEDEVDLWGTQEELDDLLDTIAAEKLLHRMGPPVTMFYLEEGLRTRGQRHYQAVLPIIDTLARRSGPTWSRPAPVRW